MDQYIIHINKTEKTQEIQAIEDSIQAFKAASNEETAQRGIAVLEAIRIAILKGGKFTVPV